METKASSDIQLLPGFRFHPSDEELIVHYLKNKVTSSPLPASIIADIDLYKFNPWELPKKALFGEDEWYFFTPRDRKYPNGARPNRAATSGYWKATGTDKPILASCGTTNIGVKKALVFYKGRPPKGIKTDWIMHEYRLLDTIIWNNLEQKSSMRLDDWVLCRVRQKNSIARNICEERNVPSSEPPGFYPKVNELMQTNANANIDMVKNYLYNDCPMVAPYTFAPQNFSCIERASSISFQSTDKSCTSSDNLLNPPKGKFAERNEHLWNYIQLGKNLRTKEDTEEESAISIRNDGTNINFCGTNQFGVTNFIPGQWNSLAQYQEFSPMNFTGNGQSKSDGEKKNTG